MAVGGAVAAFAAPSNAPATQPQPAPQPTCTLRLPDQPLTAQGLATPFVLSGAGGNACHESDADTAAFVQGLVLDPATGRLGVYDPLVIDAGTQPAVAPTVPKLPANAVVALWFGFNGDILALRGGGVKAGSCVNGSGNSLFGQFSYCNAAAFFTAADAAIAQGRLTIPPLGTAADGEACPTTRDFGIVDQDQSDNVTTTYLVLPDGRTAQNTQSAARKLAGKKPGVLANGSDNLLLDHFVDPALNCTPFTAADLANPGFTATALGLNELQAAAEQAAPVALVPVNDPMALDNDGAVSDAKTDLYRAGVNQPPLSQVAGPGKEYCANMRTIGVARTKLDRSLTDTTASPDPGAASNLFTFLAQRLQQSYVNLGCEKLLNQRNPVHLKTDANGLVVDATFDRVGTVPTPKPSATPPTPKPSASPSAKAGTSPPSVPAASPSATMSATKKAGSPPVAHSLAPHASTSPQGTPNHSTQPAAPTSPYTPTPTPAAADSGSGSPTAKAGHDADDGTNNTSAGGTTAGNRPPPPPAVTSTPIIVAGFSHTHAASAGNPKSALSGPDPMADSDFGIMSARTFYALGGALVVLAVSMLYRRRPGQRD